jgi:hypothetical protein
LGDRFLRLNAFHFFPSPMLHWLESVLTMCHSIACLYACHELVHKLELGNLCFYSFNLESRSLFLKC